MNWLYIVAFISGSAFALACKFFFVHADNLKLRTESFRWQQEVEALQSKILLSKQQLEAQQSKMQRSATVVNQVGPALISDIQMISQKTHNVRLKLLLKENGFEFSPPDSVGGAN